MLKEIKTLSRHTLIYGVGFMLMRAVGFFLLPFYTRYLTPQDYGALELLDITSYVLGPVMMLGMEQAALKYYQAYDDPSDRHAVAATVILFSIFFGLLVLLPLILARSIFSQVVFGSTRYSRLLSLSFAALFVTGQVGIAKTILRAQQRSVAFATISVVQTLLSVGLNVYFIAVLGLGIEGILYSTLITSVLCVCYLVIRILGRTGFRYESKKLQEMLKYGVFFVPAGLAVFLMQWVDRYFLRVYVDMSTVGVYALGYKIGMIIVMVAAPFTQVWGAYIFEVQKQPNAKDVYARIATYFLVLLSSGALGLAMFAREIVTIMAAPAYAEAYRVVPLIALAMVLMLSTDVMQVGLLITGRSGRFAVVKWIAAAATLCLYWLLIPGHGMMGAAAATAGGFAINVCLSHAAAQRTCYIEFEYGRLLRLGAAVITIFAISLSLPTAPLWQAALFKLSIFCLFPFVLAASGFFTRDELASVIGGVRSLRRLAKEHWRPLFNRA